MTSSLCCYITWAASATHLPPDGSLRHTRARRGGMDIYFAMRRRRWWRRRRWSRKIPGSDRKQEAWERVRRRTDDRLKLHDAEEDKHHYASMSRRHHPAVSARLHPPSCGVRVCVCVCSEGWCDIYLTCSLVQRGLCVCPHHRRELEQPHSGFKMDAQENKNIWSSECHRDSLLQTELLCSTIKTHWKQLIVHLKGLTVDERVSSTRPRWWCTCALCVTWTRAHVRTLTQLCAMFLLLPFYKEIILWWLSGSYFHQGVLAEEVYML